MDTRNHSDSKPHIVIIGATSAIAENCARLWVTRQPVRLTLVGREPRRLEQVAADLRARSPESDIELRSMDFLDVSAIKACVVAAAERGPVAVCLIAYGTLPEQAECQTNLQVCQDTLQINAVSPALFAEAFAAEMEKANKGTLAIIGSVAGDRGRKSNYVYGAAKGLLARYAQGLQHRFAGTGVTIVLIKPGPTATPMTAHLEGQGMTLAAVGEVARQIVMAIDKRQPTAYVPAKWRWIMTVIQHLPAVVFNRLNI